MGARTAEARATTLEDVRVAASAPSDGALVRRHLAGDDQAFVDIYERFYQRLVLYCRQRVADIGMAEDLAQDAFVRALEALDRFDLSRPLWPWLKTIARRLAIDQARTPDLEVASSDVDEVITIPPAMMHEERIDLERTLDNVNDRHALVLRLWYVEDWAADDVCDLLGLNRNALDQLLHRARARLREEYERASGGARAALAPLAGAAGWASDLRSRLRAAVYQSTLLGGAVPLEGARQAFAAALVGLIAVGAGQPAGPAAPGTGGPADSPYELAAADHRDAHTERGDVGPTRASAPAHQSSSTAVPRASSRTLAASSDELVQDGDGEVQASIVRGRDHAGESHVTIEMSADGSGDGEADATVTADLRCATNLATQTTCDTARTARRSVPPAEGAAEADALVALSS